MTPLLDAGLDRPGEGNTPSARRLHYWALSGGEIELSRFGLHDSTTA